MVSKPPKSPLRSIPLIIVSLVKRILDKYISICYNQGVLVYVNKSKGGSVNEQAHWKVELYERLDGTSPVTEFIEEQSCKNQAKIFAELDDMSEFGLMPRGNKLKHIEGKLWELRFRSMEHHFRFIYFAYTGKKIVVLHGFSKKTRKTPKRELNIAHRRLQDYLCRHEQ
jgi:phage-related protein